MNFREVSDCRGSIPGDQSLSQKSSGECGTPHQASLRSVRAVIVKISIIYNLNK